MNTTSHKFVLREYEMKDLEKISSNWIEKIGEETFRKLVDYIETEYQKHLQEEIKFHIMIRLLTVLKREYPNTLDLDSVRRQFEKMDLFYFLSIYKKINTKRNIFKEYFHYILPEIEQEQDNSSNSAYVEEVSEKKIKEFEKLLDSWNSIKTMEDLMNFVEFLHDAEEIYENWKKYSEYQPLEKTDKALVIPIKNYYQAVKFGFGTTWCITKFRKYMDYMMQGDMYVVIPSQKDQKKTEKYQEKYLLFVNKHLDKITDFLDTIRSILTLPDKDEIIKEMILKKDFFGWEVFHLQEDDLKELEDVVGFLYNPNLTDFGMALARQIFNYLHENSEKIHIDSLSTHRIKTLDELLFYLVKRFFANSKEREEKEVGVFKKYFYEFFNNSESPLNTIFAVLYSTLKTHKGGEMPGIGYLASSKKIKKHIKDDLKDLYESFIMEYPPISSDTKVIVFEAANAEGVIEFETVQPYIENTDLIDQAISCMEIEDSFYFQNYLKNYLIMSHLEYNINLVYNELTDVINEELFDHIRIKKRDFYAKYLDGLKKLKVIYYENRHEEVLKSVILSMFSYLAEEYFEGLRQAIINIYTKNFVVNQAENGRFVPSTKNFSSPLRAIESELVDKKEAS